MYTPNLRRELKETICQNGLEKAVPWRERKRVDATYILGILEDFPFVEYLEKSGLHKLMREIMEEM